MNKPNVKGKFDTNAGDLFGRRIKMKKQRSGEMELAVVKAWQPWGEDPFAVVFDSAPDKVFWENLLRKGRHDWEVVDWEDDELFGETTDKRPMCPQCGHPLGEGCDAWTLCKQCGFNEPGCSSAEMLSRLRSGDPHRKPAVNYNENDDESDDDE